MVMTLSPRFSSGILFLFHTRLRWSCSAESKATRNRILGNNDSKPIEIRQFTGAKFARLSSSMQLTFLIIRRAQMSSRKAIAATAEWTRRHGDF
jgi:hypothetical protein